MIFSYILIRVVVRNELFEFGDMLAKFLDQGKKCGRMFSKFQKKGGVSYNPSQTSWGGVAFCNG